MFSMKTGVQTETDTFQVRVEGTRIRARRIPPFPGDNRPTLVFLHEGLGCIEIWRDFPAALCEKTGLGGLIYDRRGYGGSDPYPVWPDHYLKAESWTFLPGVLDACKVQSAILIGHSDGGTIALMAAAKEHERVVGLITEAAHIFVEDITVAGIKAAVQSFETTDLVKKLARYHGEMAETVFRRWSDRWLSPDFRDWNMEKLLPEVRCPALILQGEDDEYGTPAQVAGIVRSVSGPARGKLIPDCGHIPHLQARKTVLAEMAAFIRRILSPSPPPYSLDIR